MPDPPRDFHHKSAQRVDQAEPMCAAPQPGGLVTAIGAALGASLDARHLASSAPRYILAVLPRVAGAHLKDRSPGP
jgi:hypothetical protein